MRKVTRGGSENFVFTENFQIDNVPELSWGQCTFENNIPLEINHLSIYNGRLGAALVTVMI